jgi:hypothetical protein
MARCPHKFELSAVVCPLGCGGTNKPQKQVASGKRLPNAKAEARIKAPTASFTDAELADALAGAPRDRGRATSRKLHTPIIRRAAHG